MASDKPPDHVRRSRAQLAGNCPPRRQMPQARAIRVDITAWSRKFWNSSPLQPGRWRASRPAGQPLPALRQGSSTEDMTASASESMLSSSAPSRSISESAIWTARVASSRRAAFPASTRAFAPPSAPPTVPGSWAGPPALPDAPGLTRTHLAGPAVRPPPAQAPTRRTATSRRQSTPPCATDAPGTPNGSGGPPRLGWAGQCCRA